MSQPERRDATRRTSDKSAAQGKASLLPLSLLEREGKWMRVAQIERLLLMSVAVQEEEEEEEDEEEGIRLFLLILTDRLSDYK